MRRTFAHAVSLLSGAALASLTWAFFYPDQPCAHEARREFCVPLYDMPGVERVRCDPLPTR